MGVGDSELAELRSIIGYRDDPRQAKRAAKRLAALGTPGAARVLAEAFLDSTDQRVIKIASQALVGLSDQAMIDAVCDVLIATGDERLSALLGQADHLPSDPGQRAVVLFLAGEFGRYSELDFDGSLLRAAYTVANQKLRRALADRACAAGRLDWVRVVAGHPRARLLDELSDHEWETTIGLLRHAERWQQIWHLALRAPPLWAARMLQALDEQGWRPSGQAQQTNDCQELTKLAAACSTVPTGAVATPAVLHGHQDRVTVLAVTPDSRLLASADLHGTVRLWRLPSGEPAATLTGHQGRVTALAITPDSQLLASASWDRMVRLWQLPSGEHYRTLTGHQGRVTALALTPDGQLLASASWDSTVRLWQLPSGMSYRTLTGHENGVAALAVAPDGRWLASSTSATQTPPVRAVIRRCWNGGYPPADCSTTPLTEALERSRA